MALKQKFNYFDAFEKQADLACQEAELLIDIIENFTTSEALRDDIARAHDIEHAADMVCHDIFDAVSVDFITPIDREDIISLTQSMDDILDYMEGTIQRFYMFDVQHMHPRAAEFAHLLLKSCEALKAAAVEFKNFKNGKKLKPLIVEVGDVEEEADTLFFDVMHDLYTGARKNAGAASGSGDVRSAAVDVFIWDKLFQRMENTADTCERASDIMRSIVMKYA
ncbi:MAG: DUF47 family protein [Slackia sp.]|nr:DUF47 family protein [Slackia sp.]